MRELLCSLGLFILGSSLNAAVVINEIHYNPSGDQGDDSYYEFLELYNTEASQVDLSGWAFTSGIDLSFAAGTVIDGNGYLVLAQDAASVEAWYTLSDVIQWDGGGLSNSGETLTLVDATTTTVDEVAFDDGGDWPGEPDGDGPSAELTNPALDNGEGANWSSSLALGGTPGAQNSVYQSDSPPSLSDLTLSPQAPASTTSVLFQIVASDDNSVSGVSLWLDEGAGFSEIAMTETAGLWETTRGPWSDGTLLGYYFVAEDNAGNQTTWPDDRTLYMLVDDNPAQEGDVVINEIKSGDDCFTGYDWFELINTSASQIDLSHWIVRDDDDDHYFLLPAGTLLPAGGYLVVAEDAAAVVTDYVISDVIGDLPFGLSQSGDAVRVYNANDVLLDEVWYEIESPWPLPPVGQVASLSLIDPALDNNLGENWQASGTPCGTPGSSNAVDTVGPEMTGWAMLSLTELQLDFNEELDATSAATTAYYSLGGVAPLSVIQFESASVILTFAADIPEGFVGELAVSGVMDAAGNEMDPGSLVINVIHVGSLVINEVHQNPDMVPDELGEFFELYNASDVELNLRGVALYDLGTDYLVLEAMPIAPGDYLVLGREGDTAQNGGVTVDYVYGSAFTLGNGADEIVLQIGYLILDEIDYDGGSSWPDPTGASMELISPELENNLGSNWFVSTTPYGLGDLGTPGAPNTSAIVAPEIHIAMSGQDAVLSWNEITGATGYAIYYSENAYGTSWSLLATSTSNSFTDVDAMSATLRYYKVVSLIE